MHRTQPLTAAEPTPTHSFPFYDTYKCRHKGYAFVEFDTVDAASSVRDAAASIAAGAVVGLAASSSKVGAGLPRQPSSSTLSSAATTIDVVEAGDRVLEGRNSISGGRARAATGSIGVASEPGQRQRAPSDTTTSSSGGPGTSNNNQNTGSAGLTLAGRVLIIDRADPRGQPGSAPATAASAAALDKNQVSGQGYGQQQHAFQQRRQPQAGVGTGSHNRQLHPLPLQRGVSQPSNYSGNTRPMGAAAAAARFGYYHQPPHAQAYTAGGSGPYMIQRAVSDGGGIGAGIGGGGISHGLQPYPSVSFRPVVIPHHTLPTPSASASAAGLDSYMPVRCSSGRDYDVINSCAGTGGADASQALQMALMMQQGFSSLPFAPRSVTGPAVMMLGSSALVTPMTGSLGNHTPPSIPPAGAAGNRTSGRAAAAAAGLNHGHARSSSSPGVMMMVMDTQRSADLNPVEPSAADEARQQQQVGSSSRGRDSGGLGPAWTVASLASDHAARLASIPSGARRQVSMELERELSLLSRPDSAQSTDPASQRSDSRTSTSTESSMVSAHSVEMSVPMMQDSKKQQQPQQLQSLETASVDQAAVATGANTELSTQTQAGGRRRLSYADAIRSRTSTSSGGAAIISGGASQGGSKVSRTQSERELSMLTPGHGTDGDSVSQCRTAGSTNADHVSDARDHQTSAFELRAGGGNESVEPNDSKQGAGAAAAAGHAADHDITVAGPAGPGSMESAPPTTTVPTDALRPLARGGRRSRAETTYAAITRHHTAGIGEYLAPDAAAGGSGMAECNDNQASPSQATGALEAGTTVGTHLVLEGPITSPIRRPGSGFSFSYRASHFAQAGTAAHGRNVSGASTSADGAGIDTAAPVPSSGADVAAADDAPNASPSAPQTSQAQDSYSALQPSYQLYQCQHLPLQYFQQPQQHQQAMCGFSYSWPLTPVGVTMGSAMAEAGIGANGDGPGTAASMLPPAMPGTPSLTPLHTSLANSVLLQAPLSLHMSPLITPMAGTMMLLPPASMLMQSTTSQQQEQQQHEQYHQPYQKHSASVPLTTAVAQMRQTVPASTVPTSSLSVPAQFVGETGVRDDVTGTAISLRLFVGKLGSQSTSDSLWRHFAAILDSLGFPQPQRDIDDIYVPMDNNGRPRGFAFVSFSNRRALDAVVSWRHPHIVDGKKVVVDVAAPRGLKVDQVGHVDPRSGRSTTSVFVGPSGIQAGGVGQSMPVSAAAQVHQRHSSTHSNWSVGGTSEQQQMLMPSASVPDFGSQQQQLQPQLQQLQQQPMQMQGVTGTTPYHHHHHNGGGGTEGGGGAVPHFFLQWASALQQSLQHAAGQGMQVPLDTPQSQGTVAAMQPQQELLEHPLSTSEGALSAETSAPPMEANAPAVPSTSVSLQQQHAPSPSRHAHSRSQGARSQLVRLAVANLHSGQSLHTPISGHTLVPAQGANPSSAHAHGQGQAHNSQGSEQMQQPPRRLGQQQCAQQSQQQRANTGSGSGQGAPASLQSPSSSSFAALPSPIARVVSHGIGTPRDRGRAGHTINGSRQHLQERSHLHQL